MSRLILAALCSAVLSAYSDEQSDAPASKYLDEPSFIIDQIKGQQDRIRKNALQRLQHNFTVYNHPRAESGKTGRDRRAEARANGNIAQYVLSHSKGVTFSEDWAHQLLHFNIDWTIAGVFEPLNAQDFTYRFDELPAVEVGATKTIEPYTSVSEVRWNCRDEKRPIETEEVTRKEITERIKLISELTKTDVVKVTNEVSGGYGEFIRGKTTADFTRTVVDRQYKEFEVITNSLSQKTVKSPIEMDPFTSVDMGYSFRLAKKQKRVAGQAVLDTKIIASITNEPWITRGRNGLTRIGYFEIGQWSDFISAKDRSLELSFIVDYLEPQTEFKDGVPTKYWNYENCVKAQSADKRDAPPIPAKIESLEPI